MIVLLQLLFLFVLGAASARRNPLEDGDERPTLELMNHKSCPYIRHQSNWTRKIIFPSMKDGSDLIPVEGRPGCYKIGGMVRVRRKIRKHLYVHVELKYTMKKEDTMPEPCREYDEDGCGGYGSCLYCKTCSERRNDEKAESVEEVTKAYITKRGKKIECEDSFKLGRNRGVYLNFCLPTKTEFIKSQGLTEEIWNELVTEWLARSGLTTSLKIRIFEGDPIKGSHYSHLIFQDFQRRSARMGPSDKLAPEIFYRSKFAEDVYLYETAPGLISCHRVNGIIKMETGE